MKRFLSIKNDKDETMKTAGGGVNRKFAVNPVVVLFFLFLNALFVGVLFVGCQANQEELSEKASVLVTLDMNGGYIDDIVDEVNGWKATDKSGTVVWTPEKLWKTTANYANAPTPVKEGYDFLGYQQPHAVVESTTFTSWGYNSDSLAFYNSAAMSGNLLPNSKYRVLYDIKYNNWNTSWTPTATGQWGVLGVVQNGSSFYSLGASLDGKVTSANAGNTTFHIDTYISTPSSFNNTWMVLYTGLATNGNFISATVSNFSMFLEENYSGETENAWASTYDKTVSLWTIINNAQYTVEYDIVVNESLNFSSDGFDKYTTSDTRYRGQWGNVGFHSWNNGYCVTEAYPLYDVTGDVIHGGFNYHIVKRLSSRTPYEIDRVVWYGLHKGGSSVASATIRNVKFYLNPDASTTDGHDFPNHPHYLLARWEPRKVTVSLDPNGGAVAGNHSGFFWYYYLDEYDYGALNHETILTKTLGEGDVDVPTMQHYTFNGYYWDGICIIDAYGDPVYDNIETLIDSNYKDITLFASWTPVTYTLSVKNGYYYSASGYSVSLTAPGCSITNSTLTESKPTSIISHAYSTTPITITISRSDANLWIYIDDVYISSNSNSATYSWTPNANHSLTWYIREYWTVRASTSEGVSSATYSKNSSSPGGGSSPSSATSSTTIAQGTIVDFKAIVKTGYTFDGWYNTSGTRVSTSATYSAITIASDVTLTAKAKKIYDLIKYDSSQKYHYFEDGTYPQTYVGDSLNSTLNGWYSSQSVAYTMFVNNTLTDCYTYSGAKYARVKCPKTYTVTLKSGTSKTFSANAYYWFKIEPIRWRVSDYGVNEDYYSTTLYSRFVGAGGVNGVSEYVLDFQPLAFSGNDVEKVAEGWDYENDGAISYPQMINYAYAGCQYGQSVTRKFDYYNNNGTNVKVRQKEMSDDLWHQVSVVDFANAGITDYRTKASDLVCMLVGVNSPNYCNYTTRDLYDLSSGKYITKDGTVRHWWLTEYCGLRLAYTSTGKIA